MKAVIDSSPKLNKTARSDTSLAQMIVQVAQAVQADVVLCATETGTFPQALHCLSNQLRIIAATTNEETYDTLTQMDMETIRCLFGWPTGTSKSTTLSPLR
jgi:pyruvate kinase